MNRGRLAVSLGIHAIVFTVLIVIYFSLRQFAPAFRPKSPTDLDWSFKLPIVSLDQREATLTDVPYRNKMFLLNFWASWCGPCREETPQLETLWQYIKEHENTGMLAVATSDKVEGVRDAMLQMKINYPVALDEAGTFANKFSMSGLPQTYLIGPDGKVVMHVRGAVRANELAQLLANLQNAAR